MLQKSSVHRCITCCAPLSSLMHGLDVFLHVTEQHSILDNTNHSQIEVLSFSYTCKPSIRVCSTTPVSSSRVHKKLELRYLFGSWETELICPYHHGLRNTGTLKWLKWPFLSFFWVPHSPVDNSSFQQCCHKQSVEMQS